MGLRLVIVDVREALLEPAAEQLRQLGAPEDGQFYRRF